MINRLAGLVRDTWWLWLMFLAAAVLFSALVSLLFIVMIPALLVAMVYYAALRYDDHGKPRAP